MGRKLEPYSFTAIRSLDKQFESNGIVTTGKTKKDIRDEITELKKELLEKIKNSTSISKSNHIIEVAINGDEAGKYSLYFHIKNMDYGEDYPRQQDCYGSITEKGIIEVFKSREPVEFPKQGDIVEEAFSSYSEKEKKQIEEIKATIDKKLKEKEDEDKEWSKKNIFAKVIAKISGKEPKTDKRILDFLKKIPKELTEKENPVDIKDQLSDLKKGEEDIAILESSEKEHSNQEIGEIE